MPDLPNILQRTAAQWAAINPFIPKGMLAIESDTGRKKCGTGLRYSATSYVPDETTAELPTSASEGQILKYASGAWSASSDLDGKVSSNTAGITGADQITNIVSLTQAEYDAIPTKSATTFYVITD